MGGVRAAGRRLLRRLRGAEGLRETCRQYPLSCCLLLGLGTATLLLNRYLHVLMVFWSFVAGVVTFYCSLGPDSLLPNFLFTIKYKPKLELPELFPRGHSCAVCGKVKCKRHRPTLLLENYQPWLDLKVPSKVDASLSEVLELVLENFIYPWYRNITDDESSVDELRGTLRFFASVLVRRIHKVDIPTVVTKKMLKAAMKHIEVIAKARQKVKNAEFLQQAALEEYGPELHVALRSRRDELHYLRKLTELLFPYILPPKSTECRSLALLIREILPGSVFLPSMDFLADPDTVNHLLLIFIDDSPPEIATEPTSSLVPFLQKFAEPRNKKPSVLKLELKEIRDQQDLLFRFMNFLKQEGAVHVLQFCLAVEEFNDRILRPELSDTEKMSLHDEVQKIYKTYCLDESIDKIRFDPFIVEEIQRIAEGPYKDVVKLQTMRCLFEAYEHVLSLLENVFTPMFCHSDEYFRHLLRGAESPTRNSKFNRSSLSLDDLRLQLTESLHLKDTDWHFVSVNPEQKGTWHRICCKYIVIGNTKHTPHETEIAPGMTASDPEQFVLGLHCFHPPLFLPKGQIVAQAIPVPFLPEGTEKQGPTVARVQVIGKDKPKLWCNVSGGGESKCIEMLVDTGADCTVIPVQDWPAHWPLQNVAGHIQGVGGPQLARQSKSIIQIEGPNGQLANIRPFVLDYSEPLLGRDLMAQWGVTIDIPDSPQDFCTAVIEQQHPTQKLKWKTDKPVEVKHWPLSKQKIKALEELVEEQLKKGHIVETMSLWNSPVFVIQKGDKKRWRLLHDLRQINNVIEDMGSPQPGMPSPTMLPQDWKLAVIDIKDCFFHIPLHPDDAPRFAFSVPTINMEAPMKRYHWTVLPQGLKVSSVISQWYVSSLLSPVRAAAEKAIIYHYIDDILVCAPNDDLLTHVLDLTIDALIVAGFELQEKKIQKMPPWKYLGLVIGNKTIVPQKLEISPRIKTLADVHKLCGSLNWVRPWLGLTNEDLAPLFNLLKGGEDPGAPRSITPEAWKALEKVQMAMSTRQAHQCQPDLPFKFIILGKSPHLHGIIFQWEEKQTPKAKGTSKKGPDKRDPLLIIEWVFLSHKRSKRMTKPQELVAELIRKARTQIRELAGCDFECIHIPIEL
ncbi:sorting nexin-14 isoform X1 [Agelaius tricolor]|uniref:sorting nexin-14 isoform X1 n=1 Tax=Agelaius tricolor TaxID=9191 RepID=UPI0039F22CDE